jgi:uridine kinase
MSTNTKIQAQREWIRKCEKGFEERFYAIAEDICKNRGLRIVRLFGPTCSGKTTAAEILISLFSKFGKRAHIVSIDDFFYDKEQLERRARERGIVGLDYDSPDTIDCDALRAFAEEIFDAPEVHCPVFDFVKGCRTGYRTMSVDEDDVFIFEGIQANYKNVTEMLSEHGSASIYIAPMEHVSSGGQSFSPNELRLMRRLVRDYHFRSSSPEFTLMLWESVRANEEKNIFPYIENTDYKVSSSMEYEIGILKPYLTDIIGKMDKNDERYGIALEILKKTENVEEIPASLIKEGMLYCEFV